MMKVTYSTSDVSKENMQKQTPQPQSLWNRYRGLVFSALAAMFVSCVFLVVKKLEHYHPITVSLWKQVASLIPAIPLLLFVVWKDIKENGQVQFWTSVLPMDTRQKKILFGFLVVRSISSTTGQLLQVCSLQYLSVGDTSIFAFSTPIVVVVLAAIFLQEKCSVVSTVVVLVTIFGIGFMVRPPMLTGQTTLDIDNLKGVSLGIVETLLFGLDIIILRKSRTVHWAFHILMLSSIGIVECSIAAWIVGVFEVPTTLGDLCLTVIALPITVFCSKLCAVMAYKFEKAGPASLIATLGVPFSFVLQFIFYGTSPDVFSTIGGGIVILGVVTITAQKYVEELPQESPNRKRFGFILF